MHRSAGAGTFSFELVAAYCGRDTASLPGVEGFVNQTSATYPPAINVTMANRGYTNVWPLPSSTVAALGKGDLSGAACSSGVNDDPGTHHRPACCS